MLARRKPPKMNVRQDKREFPSHRAWVRGFTCALFGKHDCDGRIEACHIRTGNGGGTGIKPHDKWCIPMCSAAHREQHQIGEAAFAAKYKVDLNAIAERLAATSPHRGGWSE